MSEAFTTLHDLVRAYANAMNLISPEVQDHHEKVTYFTWQLVELLIADYDSINARREDESREASRRYQASLTQN